MFVTMDIGYLKMIILKVKKNNSLVNIIRNTNQVFNNHPIGIIRKIVTMN